MSQVRNKVLTVSIAAYNVSNYLEETVESIFSPEIESGIEVIIVNDGSQDDTLEIAKRLEKNHPSSVVVVDKENGGYGSTINSSLAIARGKYYKLLDGDDWFNTEVIGQFIDYLRVSESDLIITPYCLVQKKTECIDAHQEICEETIGLDSVELMELGFHMTEMTIKTERLKEFDQELSEKTFYTDIEFIFNSFIVAKTISRFDKVLYCYRMGDEGQSISLAGYRRHYKDTARVLKVICKCYEENAFDICNNKKDILDNIIVNTIRNAFIAYMLQENPNNCREELVDLDRYLRINHRDLYELGNKSSLVHTLRMTAFKPFRIWSSYITARFKKNGMSL